MTNLSDAQMLEELVKKAVENGWEISDCSPDVLLSELLDAEISYWVEYVDEGFSDEAKVTETWQLNTLIFNKDFARALFNSPKDVCSWCGSKFNQRHDPYCEQPGLCPEWQYQLREAVIVDNPIRYMYNAVFGGEK